MESELELQTELEENDSMEIDEDQDAPFSEHERKEIDNDVAVTEDNDVYDASNAENRGAITPPPDGQQHLPEIVTSPLPSNDGSQRRSSRARKQTKPFIIESSNAIPVEGGHGKSSRSHSKHKSSGSCHGGSANGHKQPESEVDYTGTVSKRQMAILTAVSRALNEFFMRQLRNLCSLLEGDEEAVQSWSCSVTRGSSGLLQGLLFVVYTGPNGKQYKSRGDCAFALGLISAPKSGKMHSREAAFFSAVEFREKMLLSCKLNSYLHEELASELESQPDCNALSSVEYDSDEIHLMTEKVAWCVIDAKGYLPTSIGRQIDLSSSASGVTDRLCAEADDTTARDADQTEPADHPNSAIKAIKYSPSTPNTAYFTCGNTTVLNWGKLVPDPGFHSTSQLFPYGFKCIRLEWDSVSNTIVDCLCEIDKTQEDVDATVNIQPLFRISIDWSGTSSDPAAQGTSTKSKRMRVYEGRLPQQAWQAAMLDCDESGTDVSRDHISDDASTSADFDTEDEEERSLRLELRETQRLYFRALKHEQSLGFQPPICPRLSLDTVDSIADDCVNKMMEGMLGALDCKSYQFIDTRFRESSDKWLKGALGRWQEKSRMLEKHLDSSPAERPMFSWADIPSASYMNVLGGYGWDLQEIVISKRHRDSDHERHEVHQSHPKKSRVQPQAVESVVAISDIHKAEEEDLGDNCEDVGGAVGAGENSQGTARKGKSKGSRPGKPKTKVVSSETESLSSRQAKAQQAAADATRKAEIKAKIRDMERNVRQAKDIYVKNIRRFREEAKLRVELVCDREEVDKERSVLAAVGSLDEARQDSSPLNVASSTGLTALGSRGHRPLPECTDLTRSTTPFILGQVLELWGFLHTFAKPLKLTQIPSVDHIIKALRSCDSTVKKLRYLSSQTHRGLAVAAKYIEFPNGSQEACKMLNEMGLVMSKMIVRDYVRILGLDPELQLMLQQEQQQSQQPNQSIAQSASTASSKSKNSTHCPVPVNELTWREIARATLMGQLLKDIGLGDGDVATALRGRSFGQLTDYADKKLLKLVKRRMMYSYSCRAENCEILCGFQAGVCVRVPAPTPFIEDSFSWQKCLQVLRFLPMEKLFLLDEILNFAIALCIESVREDSHNKGVICNKLQTCLKLFRAKALEPSAELGSGDDSSTYYAICLSSAEQARQQALALLDEFGYEYESEIAERAGNLRDLMALYAGEVRACDIKEIFDDSRTKLPETIEELWNRNIKFYSTRIAVPVVDKPKMLEDDDDDYDAKVASKDKADAEEAEVTAAFSLLSEAMQRCYIVIRDLLAHPLAGPFTAHVDAEQLPQYYRVIHQPITFTDIRTAVLQNSYGDSICKFYSDVNLCFENAFAFNAENSFTSQSAQKLSYVFERMFLECVLMYDNPMLNCDSCVECHSVEAPAAATFALGEDAPAVGSSSKMMKCERCDALYHQCCLLEEQLVTFQGVKGAVEWFCPGCVEQRGVAMAHPNKMTHVCHPTKPGERGQVAGIEQLKQTLRFVVVFGSYREIWPAPKVRKYAYKLKSFEEEPSKMSNRAKGTKSGEDSNSSDVVAVTADEHAGGDDTEEIDDAEVEDEEPQDDNEEESVSDLRASNLPTDSVVVFGPNEAPEDFELPTGYKFDDIDAVCSLARGYSGWGMSLGPLPSSLSDAHSLPAWARSRIDPSFSRARIALAIISPASSCDIDDYSAEEWVDLLRAVAHRANSTSELSAVVSAFDNENDTAISNCLENIFSGNSSIHSLIRQSGVESGDGILAQSDVQLSTSTGETDLDQSGLGGVDDDSDDYEDSDDVIEDTEEEYSDTDEKPLAEVAGKSKPPLSASTGNVTKTSRKQQQKKLQPLALKGARVIAAPASAATSSAAGLRIVGSSFNTTHVGLGTTMPASSTPGPGIANGPKTSGGKPNSLQRLSKGMTSSASSSTLNGGMDTGHDGDDQDMITTGELTGQEGQSYCEEDDIDDKMNLSLSSAHEISPAMFRTVGVDARSMQTESPSMFEMDKFDGDVPDSGERMETCDGSPDVTSNAVQQDNTIIDNENSEQFRLWDIRRTSRKKAREDALVTKSLLVHALQELTKSEESQVFFGDSEFYRGLCIAVIKNCITRPSDSVNLKEWEIAWVAKIKSLIPAVDTAIDGVDNFGPIEAVLPDSLGETYPDDPFTAPLPDATAHTVCKYCGFDQYYLASQFVWGQSWGEWEAEGDATAVIVTDKRKKLMDEGGRNKIWIPTNPYDAEVERAECGKCAVRFPRRGSLIVHECCAEYMTIARQVALGRVERAEEQRIVDILVGVGRAKTTPLGCDANGHLYWVLSGSTSLYVCITLPTNTSAGDNATSHANILPSSMSALTTFESSLESENFSLASDDFKARATKYIGGSYAGSSGFGMEIDPELHGGSLWLEYRTDQEIGRVISWLHSIHPDERQLQKVLALLFPNALTAMKSDVDGNSTNPQTNGTQKTFASEVEMEVDRSITYSRAPTRKFAPAQYSIGQRVSVVSKENQILWTGKIVEIKEAASMSFLNSASSVGDVVEHVYKVRFDSWGRRYDSWYSGEELRSATSNVLADKALRLESRDAFVKRNVEAIPSVLRALKASQFLYSSDRWCLHYGSPMSFSESLSTLSLVKYGLLMICKALPFGALDEADDKWGPIIGRRENEFGLCWRECVVAAGDATALMQCQLMLEYSVKQAWLKPAGAKLLSSLPSKAHALRNATLGMVSVRMFLLDEAIRYDKVHVEERKSSSNSKSSSSKSKSKRR